MFNMAFLTSCIKDSKNCLPLYVQFGIPVILLMFNCLLSVFKNSSKPVTIPPSCPRQVSITHQVLHRRLSNLPLHLLVNPAAAEQLSGLATLKPGTAPYTPMRHYASSAGGAGGSLGSSYVEDSAENLTGAHFSGQQEDMARKAMQAIVAEGGGVHAWGAGLWVSTGPVKKGFLTLWRLCNVVGVSGRAEEDRHIICDAGRWGFGSGQS